MYYSDDVIEEVRSHNDIVDVLNQYISLKKKGSTYTACCPFHNEKTPSFHVDRGKQLYHCFGCGAAGTVYTFLQQYENYTFPEAVQYLAERANIKLPERELSTEEKRRLDYQSTLKEINKAAAGYFYYLLRSPRGKNGLEYLTNRGLTEETMKQFGLGFADMYRDDLYKYLKGKGYRDDVLKDTALIYLDEKSGGTDVFWNRVMFPIMDLNGKVIAFGGRVMGDGEPKYLNSRETPIFEKRRNLFALNFARRSKREGFILCEGYMDVISMHQAGFDNAVASLGTAFTIGQAMLLKRYTDKVYLAYDSDGAGVKAVLKASAILREVGLSARVISLLPYKDPDEFIKNLGKDAFEERINQAKTSLMFEVEQLYEQSDQNDPESRTKFQQEAARKLATILDPLERENYIDSVASQFYIERKRLADQVNKYGALGVRAEIMEETENRPQQRNIQKEEQKRKPQKLLLTWYVNKPELFEVLKDIISPSDFTEPFYNRIATLLFEQYERTKRVNSAAIINQFEEMEEQNQAASIVQTTLEFEMSKEEQNVAITDIVKKVKEDSIQHEMTQLRDLDRLQEISKEKEQLKLLHISLKEVEN